MKELAVLLAMVAVCSGPGASPVSADPLQRAAERLGPLVLESLDGTPASLAGLRGKVVVLNFWATWCKPCVEEMPLLADLARRYQDRGVVVVAASVDEADSRSDVARMAAALPDAMQVWVGATLDDMERLQLGASVPVTVLLDRDGGVAQRHLGALAPGSLDAQIDALLGKSREPKKLHGAVEAGGQFAPAAPAAPAVSVQADNGDAHDDACCAGPDEHGAEEHPGTAGAVDGAHDHGADPQAEADEHSHDEQGNDHAEAHGAEVASSGAEKAASRVPS